jgi:hypothetical protein
MDYLRDEDIPTIRAPNPILDAKAEARLAKAKELYAPTMPLSVINRAQAAISTGALVLLLVGLVAKLTNKPTVRLTPNLVGMFGLSEYQLKRALKALGQAGFVRITSGQGKRREITLTDEEYLYWLQDNKR